MSERPYVILSGQGGEGKSQISDATRRIFGDAQTGALPSGGLFSGGRVDLDSFAGGWVLFAFLGDRAHWASPTDESRETWRSACARTFAVRFDGQGPIVLHEGNWTRCGHCARKRLAVFRAGGGA